MSEEGGYSIKSWVMMGVVGVASFFTAKKIFGGGTMKGKEKKGDEQLPSRSPPLLTDYKKVVQKSDEKVKKQMIIEHEIKRSILNKLLLKKEHFLEIKKEDYVRSKKDDLGQDKNTSKKADFEGDSISSLQLDDALRIDEDDNGFFLKMDFFGMTFEQVEYSFRCIYDLLVEEPTFNYANLGVTEGCDPVVKKKIVSICKKRGIPCFEMEKQKGRLLLLVQREGDFPDADEGKNDVFVVECAKRPTTV